MTLDEYMHGTVKKYKGGSFYLVERSFEGIAEGGIRDYIVRNKDHLHLRNIRKRFPDLAYIPKQEMLFLDIENGGFGIDSPIISIAMAHMHDSKIGFECLFARNPNEEKPLIQYFLNRLKHHKAVVTYNGKSFDKPRIRARVIHNGLYTPKLMDAKSFLSESEQSFIEGNGEHDDDDVHHHDLYHIFKRRVHLVDAQLKTIEKSLDEFGNFIRKDDIASRDIPKLYYEYVYGRKRKAREVVADMALWKKCLAYANDRRWRYEGEDSNAVHELNQKEAKGLYEGHFKDLEGAYAEEYYPGERIDENKREKDMARLIRHNLLDTVTLVGLLCYLCGPHSEKAQEISGDGDLPF